MVCATHASDVPSLLEGGVESIGEPARGFSRPLGFEPSPAPIFQPSHCEERAAESGDPFEDFDDDDFDDEFDDDFEEDWEDDLTEDEEFPDTFGGSEDGEDGEDEPDSAEDSPFADDPDFDEA